jgi:hypothetical protein
MHVEYPVHTATQGCRHASWNACKRLGCRFPAYGSLLSIKTTTGETRRGDVNKESIRATAFDMQAADAEKLSIVPFGALHATQIDTYYAFNV